jgi:hypothetical protein
VGNTYGAYIGNKKRPVPISNKLDYAATGDPNGLKPVMPTLAPLLGEDKQPLPYVASNDITTFSILDTGSGTVSSYRFDTRIPDSQAVKFDEFRLAQALKSKRAANKTMVLVVVVPLIITLVLIAAWLVGRNLQTHTIS